MNIRKSHWFVIMVVLTIFTLPFMLQTVGAQVVNGFEVTYGGSVYDSATNQTTFTYIVTGTGVSPDLSHFDIEIPACPVTLDVVSYTPAEAVSFGIDPTTGINGIKWGQPLQINATRTYTITFAGQVVEGSVLVAVKGGNGFETASLTGPSCLIPAIDVEKFVSLDGITWLDADAAPGPDVELGTQASFRFVVTNTGNVDLSNITLSDNLFDLTTCTIPPTLVVGSFFECIVGPFAVTAGQHSNTATAAGSITGGIVVSDIDSVHFWGGDRPSIDIEKFVSINGGSTWQDADDSGPEVEADANVLFKFAMTNTGNVPLTSLTLTDSSYDVSTCALPETLEPDAVFECVIGPFPADEAGHSNTAVVTGAFADQSVTDTDSASYQPLDDDDDQNVIIIIEGPVQVININIITIFGIEIEIDPNDPILTQIKIGDYLRVEGNLKTEGTRIIIIAITIIIIELDIIEQPVIIQPGVPITIPPGCKLTGIGNNNPRIKCSNKSSKKSS